MALLYGPQAYLTVYSGATAYPLNVVNGDRVSMALDEGNIPFITALADVIRPDAEAVYNLLDPTLRNRVVLSVKYSPSATLTLPSLYIQNRTLDPDSNIVALDLATEEMDLRTYSPNGPVPQIQNQASVRRLTEGVLAQALGGNRTVQLAGATTDQSFIPFSEAENVFPDPDVSGVSMYLGGGSTNTISKSTAGGLPAVRSQANTTAGRVDIQYPVTATQVPVTQGQYYSLSMAIRGTAGTSVQLFMQYINASGAVVVSYVKSLGTVGSSFSRVSMSTTAPSGASYLTWVLRNPNGGSSGTALEAAQIMVQAGNGYDPTSPNALALHPYFSGNTSDTADYHYAWSGDANASTSIRTPFVQREPGALKWQPGTSAVDFLQNILQPVGLRLFYDVDGVWKLADNTYRVAGQVFAQSGSTLYSASEKVSLSETDSDGYPMNADAVIIDYSWQDTVTGQDKSAQDIAAPFGYKRPFRLQVEKPFPGPGQAAYLLARLKARKYAIDVEAQPNYLGRPGMEALISLPGRPLQTGYVKALNYDLPSARMTLTAKGLLQTVPGSIGDGDLNETINSDGTIGAW